MTYLRVLPDGDLDERRGVSSYVAMEDISAMGVSCDALEQRDAEAWHLRKCLL